MPDAVMLETLKIGVVKVVQRELMEDAQFVARGLEGRWLEDVFAGQMALQLQSHVLARRLPDDAATMEVPRTWFQHLKQDHAPRWVLRRWPVLYATWKADLKVYESYPNAGIAPQKLGRPVLVIPETGPWHL